MLSGNMETEAGVFFDIPFSEYRNGDGWKDCESHSSIKNLKRTPAHYKVLKHCDDSKKSSSLTTGSLVDCLVLEPDKFEAEFAIYDGIRRGAKFEEFQLANAGKIIITPSELEDARSVAHCALLGEMSRFLLKSGEPQVSLRWQDKATGIWCKGRIDVYHENDGLVVDLKTTQDPDSQAFTKSVFNYSYYSQLAFYMMGLKALDYPVSKAVVVAVTNQFPYLDCNLYELSQGALLLAEQELRGLLGLLAWCRKSNEWPGKPEAIELIGLPEYGEQIITKRLEGYEQFTRG